MYNLSLINSKSLRSLTSIIFTSFLISLSSKPTMGINLPGGPIVVPLPEGVDNPAFTFTNGTSSTVCDLLLSTNNSDLIDPDFEGPVIVRTPPGENNLNWNSDPQPGDGVEDIKVFAPGIPDNTDSCIAADDDFSVSLEFDDVGNGDILTVTPTNADMAQIQPVGNGQKSKNQFSLSNRHEGLLGSLDGVYMGFNGLDIPIQEIMFFSTTPDISIVSASSSLPSSFDPLSGILSYNSPILANELLDYSFSINNLPPYISGEQELTNITAMVMIITTPEPTTILGLLVFGGVGLLSSRKRIK